MDMNLADLFECVADHVPDREAVVWGEHRLTYRQLDERANQLAHGLYRLGIRPGEHVGILLYSCGEFLQTMLAAYKLRAVPVNVNYRYVEGELAHLFRDADLVALVHHRELCPRVAAVRHAAPTLRVVVMVDDDSGADCRATSAIDYE